MKPPIIPKIARLTTYAADWASKLGMRYQLAVRLARIPLAIRPTTAVSTATPNEDGQDMSNVLGAEKGTAERISWLPHRASATCSAINAIVAMRPSGRGAMTGTAASRASGPTKIRRPLVNRCSICKADMARC